MTKGDTRPAFLFAPDLRTVRVDHKISEKDPVKIEIGDRAVVQVAKFLERILPAS